MFSTCKIHKSWLLTRRIHSAHIATTIEDDDGVFNDEEMQLGV